jgi:hypothetical protein
MQIVRVLCPNYQFTGETHMLTIAEAIEKFPYLSSAEIAERTGTSIRSVYSRRCKLKRPEKYRKSQNARRARAAREDGVRPRAEIVWDRNEVAYLKKHWLTNSAWQIGQEIGRSKNAVIGMAHRLNLPMKRKCPGVQRTWDKYRKDIKQIEAAHG